MPQLGTGPRSRQIASPPAAVGGDRLPSGAAPEAGAEPLGAPAAPAPNDRPFAAQSGPTPAAPTLQSTPFTAAPGAHAGPQPPGLSGQAAAPTAQAGRLRGGVPQKYTSTASGFGSNPPVAAGSPSYASTPVASGGFGVAAPSARLEAPGMGPMPRASSAPSASYRALTVQSAPAPYPQPGVARYHTGFTPPPGSHLGAIGRDKNGKSVYYWVEARPTKSGRTEYYVYTRKDKRFKLKYTARKPKPSRYRIVSRSKSPGLGSK